MVVIVVVGGKKKTFWKTDLVKFNTSNFKKEKRVDLIWTNLVTELNLN